MNPDTIRGYCDEIDALTQQIRDELSGVDPGPEPEPETIVTNASDLQAALTAGGPVAIEADLVCQNGSGYSFDTPETSLRGQGGNKVIGDTNPALRAPVDVDDIGIESIEVNAGFDTVVRIGNNDSKQVLVGQAPDRVRIRAVRSTGHRGKRVFEINACNVEIIDCDVHDCYAPNKQDSQAVWIGNAPGPVLVEGGYFEAASENLMVGGDSMKIPNCRPSDIIIRGATFTKPLAWRDNTAIPVKNILELKDGHNVLIEDCDLSNCWKSAQDGYAFMFTPTNGGSLRNIVVKNCRVSEVGGIVNITGVDASGTTPRTQVSMYGGEYRTNKGAMSGSGRFCLIGRGPEHFIVEGALVRHEGNAFIDVSDDKVVEILRVVGCDFNYGTYGIRIGGYNHGDNSRGQVKQMVVEGNTISGAHSQFKERWPNNTYVA